MRLAPRYDGLPVLSIDAEPAEQLVPVTRQRRRLQSMLEGFSREQWMHPSRCGDWSVRDVVAHLVTVNEFWNASVAAGCAAAPTRVLAGFDPAATPPKLVDTMRDLSSADVLGRFVASNDALLATLGALTADQWSMPAESPIGHVPIRLVAQHALWDSWIHERDVVLPLGIEASAEPDEVGSCLQYAAALSPLMALATGATPAGTLGVESANPIVRFVVDVGDVVSVRVGPIDAGVAAITGDAVDLVEVLSLRAALRPDDPAAWIDMLGGLRAAFDA